MRTLLKLTVILFSLCFIVLMALIFKPVPIVSEEYTDAEQGIVKEIYTNKGNDIIFVMQDNSRRFYINRGLERGLELDELKEKVLGKSITVKYPFYWTPLDWNNTVRHISKVEYDDEILFNELKDS